MKLLSQHLTGWDFRIEKNLSVSLVTKQSWGTQITLQQTNSWEEKDEFNTFLSVFYKSERNDLEFELDMLVPFSTPITTILRAHL